jgi:hypothetical protein
MLDDEDEIQTQKRIRFEEVSKLVPKKLVLNTLTMLILFFWMYQNQLEHPNKSQQIFAITEQILKFCNSNYGIWYSNRSRLYLSYVFFDSLLKKVYFLVEL